MPTPASVTFIHRSSHKITATCSLLKTLPKITCAVCIDDFRCGDDLLRIPNCRHIFHRHCILPWFSRNNTCPLCRHAFPPDQPPTRATTYNNSQPHHLRRQQTYSVPIRIHRDLRQQPPFSDQQTTHSHTVYSLNFHLRPPPLDSELPPQPPSGLARLLIAEGYPEWASRACGPFWISTDSINLQSTGAGEQLISATSTNVIEL